MRTTDGKIFTREQFEQMDEGQKRFVKEMQLPPTADQMKKGKVGRNHPCPCGSGKKFKKCCWMTEH